MASPAHLPDDALQIWLMTMGAPTPGRVAKHDLVAQVRRLIGATVLLDVGELATDEAEGLDDLHELVAAVSSLADRVTGMPTLPGSQAAGGGDDARLLERSGISGHANPLAVPLHLEVKGDRLIGRAEYPAQYEGPPGCLHGGFVAAAFDDLLGAAQILSGRAGFTGTLTVKMRRPTPLFRPIEYEAWVDRAEGRKIVVKGTASHDGDLLADAEGIFISPSENNPLRAALEGQS